MSIKNFLDESKFNNFHLKLLLWCVFIITLEGYNLAVYGSIIPLIMKEWTLSPTDLGVIGSYGIFGLMSGAIVLSPFSEKFGHKKVLIFSFVSYTVFITISAFAPNAQIFAWCRFLGGIGFGGALPITVGLLSEYAPKTIKNVAITLALCGYQFGGILAPLMGIVFIPITGWRSIIWFAAIPLLLLPILIKSIPESARFLIKRGEFAELESTLAKIDANYKNRITDEEYKLYDKNEAALEENNGKVPLIALFKNNLALSTVLFCIMYFMGILVINFLITWLPGLMVYQGLSLSLGLYVSIFLNVGTVIGTVAWSTYADRKGLSKKLLILLYILGAASLGFMGMPSNVIILFLLIALTGFFFFAAHSLLSAFVSQYYPDNVRSTGVGFGLGIGQLGGVIAPTLGGALIAYDVPISSCFMLFALPGIICTIALLIVKKKSKVVTVNPAQSNISPAKT
ncbi:MFS transporter [Propionispora vibrioides]|uniref:MFS transporter, AAHS family, benzoate transport protein n=1 Tax=Propionispora vibrioides TaxID=112903 RepID=A0A1H8Y2C8_9FIRM|nr:aromatic acid/H+ symport family MFS transporter [Propionispora vibrioides]SEP46197.1 MFS transporter, AAHS family, benzoate transport protein [Propionispora vibrioides]